MPGPINPIIGPLLRQALQRRARRGSIVARTDAGSIRSVTKITGVDHYCVYIPAFDFDAQIHFDLGDELQKYQIDYSSRYDFYAELNPGANPC